MTRLAPLILVLSLLTISDAFAQVHEQPYTVGAPPEARHRTCVGTDAACAALDFQIENHEQFAIVTDGYSENAKGSVINLSEHPCDPHAIATWDAHAMGSLTSVAAYGANYCGTLSGIVLAGKSKLLGENGLLLATPGGRIYVAPSDTHVATFDAQGFGFGGLALAGRNTFTLGWGECRTAPMWGEVTMCSMPGPGGIYHLYVVTSDGGARCLSCAP
jgi:hypothetical protein